MTPHHPPPPEEACGGRVGDWMRGSLTNRITFAAVTLTASVTIVILLLSYGATRVLVQNHIDDLLAGQATLAAHRMEAALNGVNQDLAGLADNSLVINALADPAWRATYLNPFLREHNVTHQTAYALRLLDGEGWAVASSDGGPGRPDAHWRRLVLEQGEPHALVEFSPGIGPQLVIAYPVHPAEKRPATGVLMAEIPLAELFYNEAAFSERRLMVLREWREELVTWDEEGLSGREVLSQTLRLALDKPLHDVGLHIEVGDDRNRVLAPLDRLAWAHLAVLAISLLAVYLWSRRMAQRISRPLCALNRLAGEITRGGLDSSTMVNIRGEDEVGHLAAAFDLMLGRLRTSQYQLEQRVEERTRELNLAKETIEHDFHIQKAISAILRASLEQTTIEEKLEHALEVIFSIPWFNVHEAGCIFLRDENDPEMLVMKVNRGLPPQLLQSCGHLPFGKCLCGRAAAQRTTIYSDCIDHDHEITFEGMLPHGHICLPIQAGGKVLGVINLYVEAHMPRPNNEIEFLNAIANALASTIERQRAEHQERHLQGQLAHMARLSTMGEIATTLSHELNQPLATIVNFAGGSLRRIDSDTFDVESQRFALNKISEQAKLAGDIIRRVRSFVRKGGNPFAQGSVEVNQVVDEAVELVELQLRQGGTCIDLVLGEALPTVEGDKVQIKQILINLLLNAVEAMSPLPEPERHITVITSLNDEGQVQVTVHDNGPPPVELELERLFDPFYSTKASGMGMGLAICRTIIEAHQGRIWASAERERGLSFHFTLPVS